jgi:hypothetical protein
VLRLVVRFLLRLGFVLRVVVGCREGPALTALWAFNRVLEFH